MPALLHSVENPTVRTAAAALERCERCEAFAAATPPARASVAAGEENFRQGDRAGMV